MLDEVQRRSCQNVPPLQGIGFSLDWFQKLVKLWARLSEQGLKVLMLA